MNADYSISEKIAQLYEDNRKKEFSVHENVLLPNLDQQNNIDENTEIKSNKMSDKSKIYIRYLAVYIIVVETLMTSIFLILNKALNINLQSIYLQIYFVIMGGIGTYLSLNQRLKTC